MTRPISPGVAFGCVELLGAASRNALTPGGVLSLALGTVPPRDVLEAAIALRWLEISTEGLLTPTVRGERALACADDRLRMRSLVLDHIDAENPPWLQLASYGRWELLLQAPSGIRQVLVEAGLAYGDDADTVQFWDVLAARARGMRNAALTELGRRGERLTIAREQERIGKSPKWIALDSNAEGYDVLSQISPTDSRRLSIEVKASTQPGLSGTFHISRNEWDFAGEALNHAFHLWDISKEPPRLAVLSVDQVADHVPYDRGGGSWESAIVPFRLFGPLFSAYLGVTK